MSSSRSWWSQLRAPALLPSSWRLKRRSSSMDGEHIKLVDSSDQDNDHLEAQDDDYGDASSAHTQHIARRRKLILKSVALVAIASVTLVVLSRLPVKGYLLNVSQWIRGHSFLGTFVAIAMFWVAIPLCVPSTILEAISGSLFGVAQGTAVTIIGKTGGSLLAFLIGRRVGEAIVGDYLATNFPTFRALSKVMNSNSWKPLLLFQLSSIPNLVKCYGLAVTQVSGTRFALSSMVASIPHAIIWANIGHQANDIAAILSGQSELSTSKVVLLIGGALLTVGAMAFLVIYTKRELQELQKFECASPVAEDEDDSLPITIIQVNNHDNGLSLHSDENELIKVRINTNG